jgi:HAD superfamily hydrolase (TIGR01450 family)
VALFPCRSSGVRCAGFATARLGSRCAAPQNRVARSRGWRWSSSATTKLPRVLPPDFAFAFDIDGVLLHSSQPIPGASETLKFLQDHSVPFVVLTNGGGKREVDRVAELSAKLNVPLTTANFIQSHTPFQELVHGRLGGGAAADGEIKEGLRDKTILVTGSDSERSRVIAEGYGFRSVVTPADILAAEPTIWPFDPLMKSVYADTARPLPRPLFRPDMGSDKLADCLAINAVFVFNDPRDWALDIQLTTDLLTSHAGYLGTYSTLNGSKEGASLPHHGWQQDSQPRLFFSNPDLFCEYS